MSDVKELVKLIHQTSDEERTKAYEQATDMLKLIKADIDTSELIHSDDLIHFCLFRTCLIEFKINHMLALLLGGNEK